MGRYLTNIEIAPGLTARDYGVAVRDAAQKTGHKIEFRHAPMPGSRAAQVKPKDPAIGCLLWRDPSGADLSEFWSLYELALMRIRNEKGLP